MNSSLEYAQVDKFIEDFDREQYKALAEDLNEKTPDQEKYEAALERQTTIKAPLADTYDFLNCRDTKELIQEE